MNQACTRSLSDVGRGFGVEVGFQRQASAADTGVAAPRCWLDGALNEFELPLSVGLDERDVGVGDRQPVAEEAR